MIDMESGILGMEWIDGWSVREMLGGGAEGEDEEEDEEEDDLEALQDLTLEEKERVASKRAHNEAKLKRLQEAEGALGQLGVSQGELHSPRSPLVGDMLSRHRYRGSHGGYWHSTCQDARQLDSSRRPDDLEYDASTAAGADAEF